MKNYLMINKEAYEQAAEEYGRRVEEYEISDKMIMKPFIDYLKSKFKRAKILELGPGSGLSLKILSEKGCKTTAIEISKNMIEVAKRTSPETEFINDEFLSHDFGKSKYDGIFARAFIHLFPKTEAVKVISKMKCLLNREGIIHLATTIHKTSGEGIMEKSDYPGKPKRFRKTWTEEELLDTIKNLGLKVVIKEPYLEKKRNKLWINLLVK